MRRVLMGLVAGCGTFVVAAPAAATDFVPSAEPEISVFIDPGDAASGHNRGGGGGLSAYLGVSPDLGSFVLLPEVGVGFSAYAETYDRTMWRFVGGVRMGYAGEVEVSAILHGGYGIAEGEDGDASLSRQGFTGDVGVQVMWRLEPWLTFGPELRYRVLLAPTGSGIDHNHFVVAGPRIGFWL